jgi:hypothetical protein
LSIHWFQRKSSENHGKICIKPVFLPPNIGGSCSFCPHPSHFVLETATVTAFQFHRVSSA